MEQHQSLNFYSSKRGLLFTNGWMTEWLTRWILELAKASWNLKTRWVFVKKKTPNWYILTWLKNQKNLFRSDENEIKCLIRLTMNNFYCFETQHFFGKIVFTPYLLCFKINEPSKLWYSTFRLPFLLRKLSSLSANWKLKTFCFFRLTAAL